jgi:dTDP-D-glucose 4,6-dehydratase
MRCNNGAPSHEFAYFVTGGAGFIGSNLIHHIIDKPEDSAFWSISIA